MTIQPMDVIVSRDWTPISLWIRIASASRWSHVFLGGKDGFVYTTNMKLQIGPWKILPGYMKVPAEQFLKGKKYAVYRLPGLSNYSKDAGINFNEKILGEQYDFFGPAALWLNHFKGLGAEGVQNKLRFCAEVVTQCYKYMGYVLSIHLRKKPQDMLPFDCVDPRMELIYSNDRGWTELVQSVEEGA